MNMRLIVIYVCALGYAGYINSVAMIASYHSELSITLTALLISVFAISAFIFSVGIEVLDRERVAKLYVQKLAKSSQYASTSFEGVHFGGAIEKFVWSKTDATKAFILVFTANGLFIAANIQIGAVVLIVVPIFGFIGMKIIKMMRRTRRLYIWRMKRFSETIERVIYKNASRDSDALSISLFGLGTSRILIQRVRLILTLSGLLMSLLFIVISVQIMRYNFNLGLMGLIISLRLTDDIRRLIDTIIVWFGEKHHMEKLEK